MRKSLLILAAAAMSASAFAQTNVQLAPGEYFIRNVKTGKFLNEGFSWGTHGIVKDQARAFQISPATTGGYNIKSSIGYLKPDDKDLYMDGGESTCTLGKSGEYYTISMNNLMIAAEAEPYSDDWIDQTTLIQPKIPFHTVGLVTPDETNAELTTWELLTRAQLAEELAAATNEQPIDATFYLKAHNIDRNDADNNTAWNFKRNGEAADMVFPDPGWGYPAGEWFNWTTYAWFEKDNTEGTAELSQSVENVRPGYYRASYLLVNQDPAPLTITFNGKEGDVYNYTETDLWYGSAFNAFVAPENEKECVFSVADDGKLEIKMTKTELAEGQNRFAFKRIILSYLGTENPEGSSSVEGIDLDAADAPAEYYNMQGIRVAEPTTGLYIVRQGNKVSKQLIRK